MSGCPETTEHDGHQHACTIETAGHAADCMALCGGRLHRWKPTPDLMAKLKASLPPEGAKTVCAAEPAATASNPPGAVTRLLKAAADGGWQAEVIDGNGGIEITVRLTRGTEKGTATWEMNGEGAWRFHACIIDGHKYGARAIAERLGTTPVPATQPAESAAAASTEPETALATVHPINAAVAAFMAPAPASTIAAPPAVITGSLGTFMAAPPTLVSGNSPWASRYADELRGIIEWHGRNSDRNLQVHLGPSELGVLCNRQVVGKLAGVPATNHVTDPWPSIVGTAVHAWLDKAFKAENARRGLRWVPEHRVTPHPEHPGTADLYDGVEQAVVDWKNLGKDSLEKLVAKGPSHHYKVQLLLYGLGYRILGLPVKRVVLVALPRTKSSLDDMYVWDHPLTPEDDKIIEEVFRLTEIRKGLAHEVRGGRPLMTIDATPDSDTCYFCPFYRPQAVDGGPGCPGK